MESITIEDDSTFQPSAASKRFEPSSYQAAIFDFIVGGSGDAIVNAVAGSGKTTTLVEASKRLPSGSRSIFCAFNSHIVKELVKRLDGMECKTIHSIGLSTLARHLGKQPTVDANKYRSLVRKKAWKLGDSMPIVKRTEIVEALGSLVDLAQATLAFDPTSSLSDTFRNSEALEALSSLVSHFGLALPCPVDQIAPSVREVLLTGITQAITDHVISFSDMLWLPWVWELQPTTYDWVFVDECQDLNRAQLEIVLKLRRIQKYPYTQYLTEDEKQIAYVKKATGRMIFVGDPRQAIYGFSGADAQSYRNIQERTDATEFPLSVSYRCPVLIVREAQAIVPSIQARPNAELGTVRWISETELYPLVKEGDLLLCRLTAPLIATCLELIQQRIPARVRGRDIGKMLVKTVELVANERGFAFSEFPHFLRLWTATQVSKLRAKEDNESAIERALDIEAALLACFQGMASGSRISESSALNYFKEDIQSLFSDDRPGVWLSTVHRAKGLEAERIFILRPDKLPMIWRGQKAWEMEQEMNCKYIAITRALKELYYVRQSGESL